MTQARPKTLLLVLGDQLFDPSTVLATVLSKTERASIAWCFMAEDWGLCTHFRYHQHKLVFFLTAMREHARSLREAGYLVHYEKLPDSPKAPGYLERLEGFLKAQSIDRILSFEVEDRFFEIALTKLFERLGVNWERLKSPMFVTTREQFGDYRKRHKKLFMKTFYEEQRKRLGVLVDSQGEPVGGQWSFDAENRQKLPKGYTPAPLPKFAVSQEQLAVEALVAKHFGSHPGGASGLLFPTTRETALEWLEDFLAHRFHDFGAYEDALSEEHPFINHSLLTPLLNSGLLTPSEVVARALAAAKKHGVPLASLEGFIRQVIGWREFIRGVYREEGLKQEAANFWGHHRRFKPCWYDGTTGLPPLDAVIRKANRFGYAHHIERLMVAGNLMLLCELAPQEAHRWFMELFVDSADWVMGPNVYGMGIFSDGGVFATKPYLCGSNYLLKMGYGPKGEWTETMDGLYWRFIDKNRAFFSKNPRLSMMVKLYEKIPSARRAKLQRLAEEFIERTTKS